MKAVIIISAGALALSAGCSSEPHDTSLVVAGDPAGLPLRGATAGELDRFDEGDRLFERTMREPDGLGPLYIRTSCAGCHRGDGRGPGLVGKMVVTEADGVTPAADQSKLRFGPTERPYTAAGATTPIRPPEADPAIRLTYRFPPAVLGRGYIEAIADAAIEALEAEARTRTNGIRGRIHRVTYASEPNPASLFHKLAKGQENLVGRFGLKGRIATLDEFTADAFQGDMGITSPLRPSEPPNPDGLADDGRPGVDVSVDVVNAVADYMRLLEIPTRRDHSARGARLFADSLCATCHVPSLKTRTDYPIKALAQIEAPVYTDLLLHDLGPALADGVRDGQAGPSEWKTAPLIGLRFFPAYLHDGRAKTIEEAVLAHQGPGSEANPSIERFRALGEADRAELLRFVTGL